MTTALLLAACVAGGLQAGTYYVFTCGVMPGLARTDDATLVGAMRGISTAIVNPVFLASFLGAPALAVLAAATARAASLCCLVAAALRV
jgi:uncharacterized membrane protein